VVGVYDTASVSRASFLPGRCTSSRYRLPMGPGPPVGRTPSRPPHRGALRVRAGAAVAARRRPSTALQLRTGLSGVVTLSLSSCENGFVVPQVQGVFANALSVWWTPAAIKCCRLVSVGTDIAMMAPRSFGSAPPTTLRRPRAAAPGRAARPPRLPPAARAGGGPPPPGRHGAVLDDYVSSHAAVCECVCGVA